jgi:hypothetical protein
MGGASVRGLKHHGQRCAVLLVSRLPRQPSGFPIVSAEKRIAERAKAHFRESRSAGYYSVGVVLILGETHRGTNMTQMGPESLLVLSANARQRELAEYARLEYSRAEAPRMEATLLSDFEAMPSKLDGTRRLLGRARRLFRRGDAGQPLARQARVEALENHTMTAAWLPLVAGTSLVALTAIQVGARKEGASPLSAIPTLSRA